MNKGISFYWGYKEIAPEERAKLMSNLGYDCVITNADKKFKSQNGSIKYQVEFQIFCFIVLSSEKEYSQEFVSSLKEQIDKGNIIFKNYC